MKVATRKLAQLTAEDHGRRISESAFEEQDRASGYLFELIDGRVYVSPAPSASHDDLLEWLREELNKYKKSHPNVVKHISGRARVYLPGRRPASCPEPDLAIYDAYPKRFPNVRPNWKDRSPIIVVEVASSDFDKDLVRNVKLYAQVPSIREYWVLIDAEFEENLILRIYRRRHGGRWNLPIDIHFGEHYSTPNLPGFKLILQPS